MSARVGTGARGAMVLAAIAIAAIFSGDGNAAPGRESLRIHESGIGRSLGDAAGPLGVVPIPPAPAARNTSTALALAALDRRIADLDAEEESSKRELSELGAKIAGSHARSLSRGRSFYRLTRAGMLPVGGGFNELVSHAMRVERSRRVLYADLAEEKRLAFEAEAVHAVRTRREGEETLAVPAF